NGGGVPWRINSAEGELSADGKLEVKVTGLVVASSGVNPVATFSAIVSCLTPGAPQTGVKLVTAPVPATSTGNAEIEATVPLPHPCFAPIVFVGRGDGTAWFAVTGVQ